MEKRIARAVVAMAVLAGCGGVDLRSVAGDGGTAAQGLSVDLRMRATGADQFASLVLVAEQVVVLVDGVSVPVVRDTDLVSLADPAHAPRVATFLLPEGAEKVEFAIRLGAAGGFEGDNLSGWVDSRGRVLRFETTAANLALKNKATLVLDATKSLVARDVTSLELVPKFRVQF